MGHQDWERLVESLKRNGGEHIYGALRRSINMSLNINVCDTERPSATN